MATKRNGDSGGKATSRDRVLAGARQSALAEQLRLGDVMNYAQAAAFLGIAQKTLELWVNSGEYGIPVIKLGNRYVRFRRDSLYRWLQSREQRKQLPLMPPAAARGAGMEA